MHTHGRRPAAAGLLVGALVLTFAACGDNDEVSFDDAGDELEVDSGDGDSQAGPTASGIPDGDSSGDDRPGSGEGGLVEITADRQFGCDGEDIRVPGTDAGVVLTGSCGAVIVSGTENEVLVTGRASEVVISGGDNDVAINGAGQVTISGDENDYCLRDGSVIVTGNENDQQDCSDYDL